jgi:hypothetical protein
MRGLLPKFGWFIETEKDLEDSFPRAEKLKRRYAKVFEGGYISFLVFRVHNSFLERRGGKEKFISDFESEVFPKHPCPEKVGDVPFKLCVGFFMDKLHPHLFKVNERGICTCVDGRGRNFYEGLYPLDVWDFCIDYEDCILLDKKNIRYHKTPYRSKVYKEGSTELIDYVWQAGSFEFALESLKNRQMMLDLLEKEREQREQSNQRNIDTITEEEELKTPLIEEYFDEKKQ